MGVLIREMPLLAGAIFGPAHHIVCKLVVSNHRGVFLSNILENTCLKKQDVLFALADLCHAGLITQGPISNPCENFWVARTNIDLTKSCPPHLLSKLKKRIERTRSREKPGCINSSKKLHKYLKPSIHTQRKIHKNSTKKGLISRS